MIRTCTQRGYTLVELVIVVVVVATLAAMAIPAPSSYEGNKLDLAADEIAHAMRFAHSEAVRTGQAHGFHAQPGSKRVRVFRLNAATNPPTPIFDVVHPVTRQLYDVELESHAFAATDAFSINVVFRGTCAQPDLVYFDPNGTPWCTNPATVLLDSYEVLLTLGAAKRSIRTGGMTGRVSVQ